MPQRRYSKRAKVVQAVERNDFTADISSPVKAVCEAWISLESLAGWERVNAEQVHAGTNMRAFMRPPAVQIDASMQLECDGVTYEITGIVTTSDRELQLSLVGPDASGGGRNLR